MWEGAFLIGEEMMPEQVEPHLSAYQVLLLQPTNNRVTR